MSKPARASVRPHATIIGQPSVDCCTAEVSRRDGAHPSEEATTPEVMVQEHADDQDFERVEDFEEVEPEDVQEVKSARTPDTPTPAEVETHRETHLPYRSWCLDCVLGRGGGQQHRKAVDGPSGIPVIALDYFFMTPSNIHFNREDAEQDLDEGEALEEVLEQSFSDPYSIIVGT